MLEIATVALPVLKSVTPLVGLLVPTAWLAKARLEVLKVTVAAVPVPVSETVCGLPEALSLTERAASSDPAALGVKVTLMAQLVAAARELPQLLVWEKSEGFVPVMPMLVIVNVELPGLLRITVLPVLLWP